MGYTRQVRFTAPVDPRTVWSAVLAVIGAGPDYTTEKHAPGKPETELFGGPNGCWRGIAESGGYHTDTILAVPTMIYGADGGAIVDDTDDYGQTMPPAAYAEIHFDVSYSRVDAAIEAANKLAAAVGVPAAWSDDFTAEWTPATS